MFDISNNRLQRKNSMFLRTVRICRLLKIRKKSSYILRIQTRMITEQLGI